MHYGDAAFDIGTVGADSETVNALHMMGRGKAGSVGIGRKGVTAGGMQRNAILKEMENFD